MRNDFYSLTLGGDIKRIRLAHMMSQEEFAKALGVSKGTVYLWEKNKKKPHLHNLRAISEFNNKGEENDN